MDCCVGQWVGQCDPLSTLCYTLQQWWSIQFTLISCITSLICFPPNANMNCHFVSCERVTLRACVCVCVCVCAYMSMCVYVCSHMYIYDCVLLYLCALSSHHHRCRRAEIHSNTKNVFLIHHYQLDLQYVLYKLKTHECWQFV